jgi:very-short-patch-repair endonuclease
VLRELTNRGLRVVPQVGTAGYRIDLGVLDDVVPGRFLCAIECDGVAYHESETARDRDRLRQQVLEARGWVIYRVWSTDWFKDRQGQIDRLLKLIDDARTRARVAGEPDARAPEVTSYGAAEADENPYERPLGAPYKFTPGEGRYAGADFLEAPLSQLVRAVVSVVETESPIHEIDLFGRVAAMWDSRVGSRIQARLREASRLTERDKLIRRRGPFYWGTADTCAVRSRAGTRIPADRIAPEEYREAVLAVLASGHGFSRSQLTNEVRAMLGFSRTGAALDEAIGTAIDGLRVEGRLGEASMPGRAVKALCRESAFEGFTLRVNLSNWNPRIRDELPALTGPGAGGRVPRLAARRYRGG